MKTVFQCKDCAARREVEHFTFADASPPVCHGLAMMALSSFDTDFHQPGGGPTFAAVSRKENPLDRAVESAISNANWKLLEEDE